jgi:hypothetical protein
MKPTKTFHQVLAFISLAIFLCFPAHSQPTDLMWKYAKSATNGIVDNMIADSVGNVYLSGRFYKNVFNYQGNGAIGSPNESISNIFLMKTAPTGRLIWLHAVRSLNPDVNVVPGNMSINQRGELSTVFTISSETEFQIGDFTGETAGNYVHTLIAKISKTGFISWVHEISTVPDTAGIIYLPDLFLDEDGTTYLSGAFEADSIVIGGQEAPGTSADAMLFITRIHSEGAVEWLTGCDYNKGADNGEIVVTDIANSNSDYFYIGGYHRGDRPFYFGTDSISGTTGDNAFIAFYTKDGESQWARSFPGDSSEYINNLIVPENGNVFVSGVFNSGNLNIAGTIYSSENGNYDLFIAKYGTSGNCIQSKHIAIQKSIYSIDEDVVYTGTDPEGNLIICSDFYSESVFTGSGFELNNPDAPTSDMMMAKLDGMSLDPVWTNQGTSTGDNNFESVFISREGEIYFTGTSYNKLNVDLETVDENLTAGSPYVAKIITEGILDYLYWQPNTVDNTIYAGKVACDKYGNAYVSGNFFGPDNMLDDIGLVQPGDSGVFIARYSRVRNVSGTVFDDVNTPVSQGYVKIYGYTYYQRSPINDSVDVDLNGNFTFQNIPYGQYILVALPGDDMSAGFVPTYFPAYEYWEFAEQIIVDPTSVTEDLNIHLQPLALFEGITQVDGQVLDAEAEDLKSAIFEKGKPSKKASVVLAGQKHTKSTYEIVATTETDEDGNFAFYGIEDGNYYLWVDIPGLPVEEVYFIEVSGHQYVSSLDYLVTEEEVVQDGFPEYSSSHDILNNPDILIYPNPAKDILIIELVRSSVGVYDVFDSGGRLLKHKKMASGTEILDISGYPSGDYIIRVITDHDVNFRKINFVQ